jgi:hypothetical protein
VGVRYLFFFWWEESIDVQLESKFGCPHSQEEPIILYKDILTLLKFEQLLKISWFLIILICIKIIKFVNLLLKLIFKINKLFIEMYWIVNY